MIDFRHVSTDDFARTGSEMMAGHIGLAIAERGECHLALSGGRAPWALFGLLAKEPIAWTRVHIWQVDERVAPDRDVDRNSVGIQTSLLALAPIPRSNVHFMDVTAKNLDEAADRYANELAACCDSTLDLVHLGLGADGHTASWCPNDAVVGVVDRDVAITGLYDGFVRMTLTVPCINRARNRLFLITGSDKEQATQALVSSGDIPACRVTTEATEALVALAAPLSPESN